MNNNNPATSVIAADDHWMFLEGLKSLFTHVEGYDLLDVCGDGDSLLELARRHRPGIVLLDISMPGASAETVVQTLTRELPETHVIALTMHMDAVLAEELFALGLAGYVSKADAFDELEEAIAALQEGRRFTSSRLGSTASGSGVESGDTPHPLSERELSVLRYAALGHNNQQIAEQLWISERTVRFHLGNCCDKLKANGRANAIAKAMQLNLIRVR